MADGTKVGSAYVEVTPKAASNFDSVLEQQVGASVGESKGEGFGSAFSGGMQGAIGAGAVMVGSILADMVEAGAQKAVELAGEAFEGFADFQQLSGGMEKLFGDDASIVLENASKAFETAGMSANEYMEKTTTFSAALVKSCGGDTEEAARLADVAIRAMSDNYNTFGTDAASVQNAFMGLAKQNYTMLDNLSLGYAGTQQGMMDLINDSGVLGYELTDTAQLAEVGFGTMVEAIQAVQTEQGIAGTTFNEYKTTVSGSLDALRASWQNWLTELGKPDADMGAATDQLLATLETAAQNVIPLVERIVGAMGDALPGLIESIGPVVIPAVSGLVAQIAPTIAQALPSVVVAGVELFTGLVAAAEVMLPVVVQAVASAEPMMAAAGLQFFGGLGEALGAVGAALGDAVIYLVTHLPQIVLEATAYMFDAGAEFVGGFVRGIMGYGDEPAQAASDVTSKMTDAAKAGADASSVAEAFNTSLMANLDTGEMTTQALELVDASIEASSAEAQGSTEVGDAMSQYSAEGVDVAAMDANAMAMVQSAIESASSVDASGVGKAFSSSAAGGMDTSALDAAAAKLKGMDLNQTATVSVQADLSGVAELEGASGAITAAYDSMSASIANGMQRAASAASAAASSIRRSIDIPNKTVTVSVAQGYTVLPHFSMSGTFDPKTGAVPSVSVSWWERGGLFTQPAIIGVGEGREPEGVFPLSHLEDMLNFDQRAGGGDTYIIEKVEYLPDSEMARYARGVFAEAKRIGRM